MSDQTRELADQAAEAVRALNHLTMPDRELKYPADVYEVVAGLRAMADRLPQLFGQLAAFLIAEANAGRVGHDSGEPARTWIDDVLGGLTEASDAADSLAAALAAAHNAAGGLKAAEPGHTR